MPANVTPLNPIGFLTPFGPREINEVAIDAILDEEINHEIQVTEHPVEVAARNRVLRGTVFDNAFLRPTAYRMRGVISDFPISWRLFDNRYANIAGETRSLSAYQLLLKHFREVVPFTLITPFGDLENMLFRRLSCPRTPQTKHAIMFRAEIIEIQVVVPDAVTGTRNQADVEGEQAQTQGITEIDRGDVTPPSV